MEDIKNLTLEQLGNRFENQGIQPYRANQVFKWIYQHQEDHFSNMTNVGQNLRKQLTDQFNIDRLDIIDVEISRDGSKKFLFGLNDGLNIESVLMPEKNRNTLCISSQVGCAQGCKFCLTGTAGLKRNLTSGEIIAQVRDVMNFLGETKRLNNIVLMGMGEPLANYQNVVNALSVITDEKYGLGFSSRRITLSTVGILPRLLDLNRDTSVNLAISLNATQNATRNMLMPINKKYPIDKLISTCSKYQLAPGRKITFEYVLIKEINDSPADANRLVKLLKPIRSKINLIPFNSHSGSDFERPDEYRIEQFRHLIEKAGYIVMVRDSKGQDISAACGQLSIKTQSN